jgi:hypothetical protein
VCLLHWLTAAGLYRQLQAREVQVSKESTSTPNLQRPVVNSDGQDSDMQSINSNAPAFDSSDGPAFPDPPECQGTYCHNGMLININMMIKHIALIPEAETSVPRILYDCTDQPTT